MIQTIDILPYVLSEEYWWYCKPRHFYSHHCYLHSPYETDDSCDNCDGARCEGCERILDKTKFELSIPVDKLEDIVVGKLNIDEEIARELIYTDRLNYTYKGYRLHLPSDREFEERYPEEYKKMAERDKSIWEASYTHLKQVSNELFNPECYGHLKIEILKMYDANNMTREEKQHINNQIDMMYEFYMDAVGDYSVKFNTFMDKLKEAVREL